MDHLQSATSQVFWYQKLGKKTKRLTNSLTTDVVVVGGGMAGLSAAQSFREKGCKVVVLEKYFCGSGASGKSSGFITPDSELNLSYFDRVYGAVKAKQLWEFVLGGCSMIENNIKQHQLACDYSVEDTLVVANEDSKLAGLEEEHLTRQRLGYESHFYTKDDLAKINGGAGYFGGTGYGKTFGINPYLYLQEMKNVLERQDVEIYEEAPVTRLNSNSVEAGDVTIQAQHIVVCADYAVADLGKLTHETYHAQTFIILSEPLREQQIEMIFPDKKRMVWDTDFIYQYYRIVDGNRLLVGGSSIFSIYAAHERWNAPEMYKKLTDYVYEKFPKLNARFSYMWPGLIGISKDIMPLAGRDAESSSIYYISGVAGLPWASALGNYSADHIFDGRSEMDEFFKPNRSYPIDGIAQSILGKKITFAVSNLIAQKK
jgi:gamma-glutamylputrescine oxidase